MPVKRVKNKCKRGHVVAGGNAYKRPDGYVECCRCRDIADKRLRDRTKKEPVTMERVRDFAKLFWSRVQKTAGCWLWQGTFCGRNDRYGRFTFAGYSLRPNRFALALKLGRLPKGLACHTCDAPLCVRKKHLYEGTDATNMRDRDMRGRAACGLRNGAHTMPWRVARGARNGNSKLSEAKVRAIRELYAAKTLLQVDLAARFGITQPLVSAIVLGKIWKDV